MDHDFVLLDRSGSMSSKWQETLSALNVYVQGLAEKKVDTGVTLATFDSSMSEPPFEVVRDRIIPSTWKPITNEEISPRGYTPLNDAIGKIVTLAKKGINGVQYDKVALMIITDGLENASTEYNHAQAKALLEECRTKGWQVTFVGADFDNAQQAASYGARSVQTVSVAPEKLRATMSMYSGKRAAFGASGQSVSWSDAEKEELKSK